jgi:hypothetical protein
VQRKKKKHSKCSPKTAANGKAIGDNNTMANHTKYLAYEVIGSAYVVHIAILRGQSKQFLNKSEICKIFTKNSINHLVE